MPTVTIAPSITRTQTDTFQFALVFDISDTQRLTGFSLANLYVRGSTDVTIADFSLVSSDPDDNTEIVEVSLDPNISGTFEVGVTGNVNVDSMSEMLSGAVKTIRYDTMSSIGATLGTPEYRDGSVIAIPVTFADAVIAPQRTVFVVQRVSGDALYDVEYYLVGNGTDYELIFQVPPNRKGSFSVDAEGNVLKEFSLTWDAVTVTPLTVIYDSGVPRIVAFDIPASYSLGSPVDVRVAYNKIVTGWNANNTITEDGIFELGGADIGTPLPYKWVGSSPPNFDEAVPADLTGTDWHLLATPPAGDPTPENNFDDSGVWHGESSQYYLIRFQNPLEVGLFTLRERVGRVAGPVS